MARRPYACPCNGRRQSNKSIGTFARQATHVHLYSRICGRRKTLRRPRHSLNDPRPQPEIFLAVAGDDGYGSRFFPFKSRRVHELLDRQLRAMILEGFCSPVFVAFDLNANRLLPILM